MHGDFNESACTQMYENTLVVSSATRLHTANLSTWCIRFPHVRTVNVATQIAGVRLFIYNILHELVIILIEIDNMTRRCVIPLAVYQKKYLQKN